jgi:hypothetical protein
MKRWRNSVTAAALLASAAGLTIALPAFGQDQETPESLLPEGFGDPVAPTPSEPDVTVTTSEVPRPSAAAPVAAPPVPGATPAVPADEAAEAEEPENFEMPEEARRSVERVGALTPETGGMASDAFGRANGRFLSTMMRRMDAPLASRWASILLRRALLSQVASPAFVPPVDWVAERAWLLLRMGEADAAKALVQSVDVDRFTPKMYEVAAQVALATADPAAFCPLAAVGETLSKEPIWPLANAICAGLSGESGTSAALIDRARQRRVASGIDLLLAEKVIGAGTNSRRAVNIQWDGVDQLTTWRFGMASAVAVQIPDALYATVGPHVRAWQARAPLLPLATRIPALQAGAVLGVFSNASLVDSASQLADETGALDDRGSTGSLLRLAYAAQDPAARMEALRAIWADPKDGGDRYARLILTARAAARIAPATDYLADADMLVGSMMSAGLDTYAARWARLVSGGDEGSVDGAWAMLAVGAPQLVVDTSRARIERFADRAGDEGVARARLLVAALAGLGRLGDADVAGLSEALDMRLGGANSWTRAIDLAAARDQAGTVVLLAGAGLQSSRWSDIPPRHMYHIMSALRRAGHEAEARMIAAEAIERL